jgi:hypothetical protein
VSVLSNVVRDVIDKSCSYFGTISHLEATRENGQNVFAIAVLRDIYSVGRDNVVIMIYRPEMIAELALLFDSLILR